MVDGFLAVLGQTRTAPLKTKNDHTARQGTAYTLSTPQAVRAIASTIRQRWHRKRARRRKSRRS